MESYVAPGGISPMASASRCSISVAAAEPIYVEVSSLLNKNLTGIGRLVARMVETLVQLRPLRLVTTIQKEHALSINLSTAFLCGQEIELQPEDTSPADDDVAAWVRQLLHYPRRKHDLEQARQHPLVYTMLRPAERYFRRELCLFYDFTPLVLPEAHLSGTREHYGIFFTQTSAMCDKALAISRSTKTDAGWLAALPYEDVVVSYPGPSLCVRQHACPHPVTRQKNVILVVATWEPRKNGRFLLDWFLNTSVLPAGMELWWVGPLGWLSRQADGEKHRRGGRSIRFLGMVSDRRLCEAYREAAFTIYPSLYEGFGFPVLDSLWHGAAVLSSFNSSLQEFAGPGVFFFDACDPESLDCAYREMVASHTITIDRDALAERFSWEGLARTIVELCA